MFKRKYQAVIDEMKPSDVCKENTLKLMMKHQRKTPHKAIISFVSVCLVMLTMNWLVPQMNNSSMPESSEAPQVSNQDVTKDIKDQEVVFDTEEKMQDSSLEKILTLSNGIQVQALGLPEEIEYEEYQTYETRLALDELSLDKSYLEGVNSFNKKIDQVVFTDEAVNQVYSPVSLYLALSAVTVLAENETQKQYLDYLGSQSIDDLLINTNHYIRKLQRNDYEGKVQISNSLWLDDKAVNPDLDKYQLLADEMYFSTFTLDMQDEDTQDKIKQWLLDSSDGKIGENYELNPEEMMELINCINYETFWVDFFREENNTIDEFYGVNESYKTTYMNDEYMSFKYTKVKGIQAISKPSSADKDILFMLPDEEMTLRESSQYIHEVIESYYASEGEYQVTLSLPKFDFNQKIDMKEVLVNSGGAFIFDDQADFDSIHEDLYFTSLTQETKIAVDEYSISAASATLMGSGMGGFIEPKKVEMILNRPFIMCVVDRNTQTVLFTALVHQPEKAE